ncbi:MAG: PQQ-binding-like beta-propeller repeat protein [Thermoplasmatota archaeon]
MDDRPGGPSQFPILAIAAVLLISVGISSVSAGGDWISFRGNLQNTAASHQDPGNLTKRWEFEADSSITTSVVIGDGYSIFGTFNGSVYRLDTNDGAVQWEMNLDAPVQSTPALDTKRGAVYICDSSGTVTSLHLVNGTVKWQWVPEDGNDIRSSPLVDDKIYFGSYDSYLYALETDGRLAWRFEGCLGWIHTSPSKMGDMVYFGSCDGMMRAVSASTGEEVWNFTSAYIPSSPAISEGRVYFGAYDSNFYCIDAYNGSLIWNTTLGNNIYSSPSVNGESVVVGCDDGKLYCMDAGSGDVQWVLDLGPSPLESSPLIAGGRTMVCYDQGMIVADLESGIVKQRFLWGNSADVSPSTGRGLVLFGDAQGYVYCLESGKVVDDDDDMLDLNDEVDARRDVIFFAVGMFLVVNVLLFVFLRKYRKIRKNSRD